MAHAFTRLSVGRRASRRVGRAVGVVVTVGATMLSPIIAAHTSLHAQGATTQKPKAAKVAKTPKGSGGDSTSNPPKTRKLAAPPLFTSDSVLAITLTTNVRTIKRDKRADAPWRAATVSYATSDGKTATIPVRIKTRGIWRLNHCDYPPLRLKVANKDAKGTPFHDLDEPKLVSYCRDLDSYERYVLQEFQLYRVYRQLTDVSHQVRLLRVTYVDSATKKVEATRYSFIIEDPKQVAARAGGEIMERKGATAEDLDPRTSAIAYSFQYLIGNTDFSFSGLHNGQIVGLRNGVNLPVPYDFDFAGVIDAPHAGTDPSLPIRRVRDRLFRGFCGHEAAYASVFDLLRSKQNAIYGLYADSLGALLAPGTVKSTLSYYDGFYKAIATPKDAQRQLFTDCLKVGG